MSVHMSASTLMAQLNSNGMYRYTNEKTKRTIDEDKNAAQDSCSTISTALRRLQKLDFDTLSGKSTAKKQIKTLISSYNDLLDLPDEKMTSELKRKFKKLNSLIDEYAPELEKVGIKKTSKNQLAFDRLAFETTETEEFNAVFEKGSNFCTQFNKCAKSIKSITGTNILQNITTKEYITQSVSANGIQMATSANGIFTNLEAVSRLAESGSLEQTAALDYLKNFVLQFNQIFQNEKEEQTGAASLQDLKDTVQKYSSSLNDLGIQIKDDGVNGIGSALELIENTENNESTNNTEAADSQSAFSDKIKNLANSGFISEMQDVSQKLFCELLSTSKNNIIIDSLA